MKRKVALITIIAILLTMLTACAKPEEQLSVTELLDLGEKYLLELNYEQAVVQFLKVIEIEPNNPRGYTGAAEAYVGLGQMDKAIAVLRQGQEQLPDDPEIMEKM
ncbi:MAG: tetratricopeptide repeat protein, partial [Syntrophomonadaceae bacterium]|nr:tetratricopeptide repeat protein [Syntrophomonadaceae bacterium]